MVRTSLDNAAREVISALCEVAVWPDSESRVEVAVKELAVLSKECRGYSRYTLDCLLIRITFDVVSEADMRDASRGGLKKAWMMIGEFIGELEKKK